MAPRKYDSQKSTSRKSTKSNPGASAKKQSSEGGVKTSPNLKDQLSRLTSRQRIASKSRFKKGQLLVFTVEEAREELERIRKVKEEKLKEQQALQPAKSTKAPAATPAKPQAPKKPQVVAAASLMDILGFDPTASSAESMEANEREKVPEKWLEFYDSLVDLRKHFKEELEVHTKDSLALDGSEESSKYSGYGQEQTDSDSGQFDREIALNMLAHEQDALFEVEEAIVRILKDQYGVCEITGKAIKKTRLRAVPFTRYSLEGQQELELRSRPGGYRNQNTFMERDEDAPKMMASDDDDE